MAKETVMRVVLDAELKEQVEKLYAKQGMTFEQAIRLFAEQSLRVGGLPFAVGKSGAFGALAKYADASKIEMEDEAVSLAMKDKFGAGD